MRYDKLPMAAAAALFILAQGAPVQAQGYGQSQFGQSQFGQPPSGQPSGGLPADPCEMMSERAQTQIAYLGPQLGLSAAQQPLWDRWQQKVLAAAAAEQARCASNRPQSGSRPTAMQREDMFIVMAGAQIAAIKQQRPDLQALYSALSDQQRAVFDRAWPPLPPGAPGQRQNGGQMPGMGQGMDGPPPQP
jgi:hypothetical protein